MKVLIVEPGKRPRKADIAHTLESMQAIVDGCIEITYPWKDAVGLVCNDEGLLRQLPFNRLVAPGSGIFGGSRNRILWLTAEGGAEAWPELDKAAVARELVQRMAARFAAETAHG